MIRKSIIYFVLGAVSTISAAWPQDLTDPYEIMTRHFEAIGGLEALKNDSTEHFRGDLTMTGMSGTVEQWIKKPDRERSELDLGLFEQTMGDNGEYSWVIDPNGKLKIIRDEETLKRRKIQKLMAQYDHANRNSSVFTLSLDGVESFLGRDFYVIRQVNDINDDIRLYYIDATTFMVEKTIEIQPDEETHTVYSDFRKIGGIIRPFRHEIEIKPIGQNMTLQITQFESCLPLDNALFEPPDKDAADFRFTSENSAENIPFEYIGEHIYLPVTVQGKERRWILDSGAGITVVDRKFADELGLKVEGSLKGRGAGNAVDFSFTTLPPFSITGIEFDSQTVAVIDIDRFFKRFDLEVAGILGYDFLSRFVTRIDYAERTLSFYDPDEFQYTGRGTIIDAPLSGQIFNVPVRLDGREAGRWAVDLGAGSTSIHRPYARKNGLLERPGVERIGMGAGGTFAERTVRLESIELAGYQLKDPLIDIHLDSAAGAFTSSETSGNLGNTLFRHFVLYLDYENQRLIVEKGDDFDRTFPVDRSGLQVWLNDSMQYEIAFVADRTPGSRAGLQKGDIIETINDIETEYFENVFKIQELFWKEAGTVLKLKIRRGDSAREISLKLDDLY